MKIAAIQITANDDKEARLEPVIGLIEEAADEGARLVCLPEYFAWYGPEGGWADMAKQGDEIAMRMGEVAHRLKIFLLTGSILFPGNSGKVVNESILLGPDGREIARYRKINLFDYTTSENRYCESDLLEAGKTPVVAEIVGWRVGFSICYDLRFPELYKTLRDMGAELIVAPSAFTYETGKVDWADLVRNRAIEAESYIVAPALTGETNEGKRCWGHSMIVDPTGNILVSASEEEGKISAVMDRDRVAATRENNRR